MTDWELTVKINTSAKWIRKRSPILSPHSIIGMTVGITIWICIEDNIPEFLKIQRARFEVGIDLPIEFKKSSQIFSIVWQAWFDFIVWIGVCLQNFIDEISTSGWGNPLPCMDSTIWATYQLLNENKNSPIKIFFLSELLFLSPKWRPMIGRSSAVVPICFNSVTSGNSSATKSSHWWSSSKVKYSKG